jgi:NAD dependent epimerase/dehydratase family enzyme
VFGVPKFALKLALGQMADEALLASQRAVPDRLREAGFTFRYPDLEGALRVALGK